MKSHKLLAAIMLSVMTISITIPVIAAGPSDYLDEPAGYYSDSEFDKYYEEQKVKFGTDEDERAKLELLQFIYGGHCTYAQLRKILEDGYLTEFIDRFKASGLLESDYELPSSVTVIPTNITFVEGGSDEHKSLTDVEGTTLKHELEDFSIENENNIVALLQDQDPADAYVSLPDSLEDKKMHGFVAAHSFYNGEPVGIAFTDKDGNVTYAWTFKDVLYRGPNEGQLDLAIQSNTADGGTLSFNLEGIKEGDGATLHIPLAEDDRDKDYSIIDEEGNIIQTVEPDDYGFITLTGLKGKHTYTVKRDLIRIKGEGEENKNNEKPSWTESVHASRWIMVPVLAILIIVGGGLIIFGIRKDRK